VISTGRHGRSPAPGPEGQVCQKSFLQRRMSVALLAILTTILKAMLFLCARRQANPRLVSTWPARRHGLLLRLVAWNYDRLPVIPQSGRPRRNVSGRPAFRTGRLVAKNLSTNDTGKVPACFKLYRTCHLSSSSNPSESRNSLYQRLMHLEAGE
jgi:hypothetical protein